MKRVRERKSFCKYTKKTKIKCNKRGRLGGALMGKKNNRLYYSSFWRHEEMIGEYVLACSLLQVDWG
jgi:hypothetical protein